ncbi:MAG: hypothetical protein JKX85_09095 [Phycisphaeraceae bacterium]|nr:hypothetical protein [Phycisphaeraceae bacterium]
MTTPQYDENLILGYVENTLTAKEKMTFEDQLKANQNLASLVDMMMQDRLILTELDQVTAPMELGDYVSTQLQRQVLLGPLTIERKHARNRQSTPRSRSQFRMAKLMAYGSLAAMFMLVVGLMYHHIGDQSLIQRTENFVFDDEAANSPIVAMKQSSPQDNSIDQLLESSAARTSGKAPSIKNQADISTASIADESQNSLARADESTLTMALLEKYEKPQTLNSAIRLTKTNADLASRKEVNLGLSLATTSSRGNELKRLSPTMAKLAQAPSKQTISGVVTSNKMIDGNALHLPKSEENQRKDSLTWADDLDTAIAQEQDKRLSSPVAMTAPVHLKERVLSKFTSFGSKIKQRVTPQIAPQQNTICLIQSSNPMQTIQDINQWAIRNRVTISTPKTDAPKAKDRSKPESEASNSKKTNTQQVREVITLNMPANQVPVLIQWLNRQPMQQNNWIQPLPKTRSKNTSLQRLQQEMPLAPTLPLVDPQQYMQVQLMVVAEPKDVRDQD